MMVIALEISILLALAIAGDIKKYKIANSVTFTFVLIGFITSYLLNGVNGVFRSMEATLLPIVLLIILYALRMLGAGDIKLFSAIGAIMGINFILYTIAYAFLWGGLISLVIIYVRKNGKHRFKYLFNYLKACLLSRSLLPYTDFEDKGDGAKFRFSYAILCGTITQAISTYIKLS
ncbi:MAG: Flp pilus assembly protein protease CpaA [Clostridiales bacterium]|jgi:prepilin peptidase CpaA|nr:Flp pilus assembly protein protease CpaA [Clostridiales bacterium]